MKKKKKIIIAVVLVLLLLCLEGWKIPIVLQIETLKLPNGSKMVYPTRIIISDVYWLHIQGEKVVKCSMEYEEAREYIETHNSEEKLKHISIDPYGGFSDNAIYDSEWDEEFWKQPDCDYYIMISYFKLLE